MARPRKAKPNPPDMSPMDGEAKRIVIREAGDAPRAALSTLTVDRLKLRRQLEVLERTELEELRDLGRNSFWFFLTEILFPAVWRDHYTVAFHKPICDEIQRLQRGENLMLLVARESRKSYIGTVAHFLWRIVCDPDIRVLLIGDREDVVFPFARVIRSAFIPGTPGFEKFQQVYPDFVIHDRKLLLRTDQFTHPLRTRVLPDPTFRATYLGVAEAFRADLICFDDAVSKRRVSSPEMAADTLRKMMQAFPFIDNINSRYSNIMICGTRRSYCDPYGVFIGEKFEETAGLTSEAAETASKFPFKVIARHVMEDPDRVCTACPAHVVKAHPHGHPSMDENAMPAMTPIVTRELVEKIYDRYCIDPTLGEPEFWHEYMNVCLAPSQQKLRAEWFDRVIDRTFWPSFRKRLICLDDASKDQQKAGIGDFSVALFGEFGDDGRLLLVYGIRDEHRMWTKDEFIRRMVSWCQANSWWPSEIVKEKVSTDAFLGDAVKEFGKTFHPVAATGVSRGKAGKEDWIIGAVQGPLERAEVIFGRAFPEPLRRRISTEGCSLGRIAHDDGIDTLGLFFAPNVRVIGVSSVGPQSGQWKPPDIPQYDPDRPRRAPAVDPAETVTTFELGVDSGVKWRESDSDWW